jgi:presenilin-like A22 family membrane protease
MFAVWKSGHMVTLAKFQTSSKSFAGFVIPYGKTKGESIIKKGMPKDIGEKGGMRIAILGGGDIAFPLLFAGVVMDWLISTVGLEKIPALLQSSIISLFAAGALLFLFMWAKKDRFYPAMPFISAGCFLGLGIIWLINFMFFTSI